MATFWSSSALNCVWSLSVAAVWFNATAWSFIWRQMADACWMKASWSDKVVPELDEPLEQPTEATDSTNVATTAALAIAHRRPPSRMARSLVPCGPLPRRRAVSRRAGGPRGALAADLHSGHARHRPPADHPCCARAGLRRRLHRGGPRLVVDR